MFLYWRICTVQRRRSMQAWSPKMVTLWHKTPIRSLNIFGGGSFPRPSDTHAWHWTMPMRRKKSKTHLSFYTHKEEVNNTGLKKKQKQKKGRRHDNGSIGGQAGRHNVKGCVFIDSHSCIRTRVFRNRLTLGSRKHWENTDFHCTGRRRRKPTTVYEVNQLAIFFFSPQPGQAHGWGYGDATIYRATMTK